MKHSIGVSLMVLSAYFTLTNAAQAQKVAEPNQFKNALHWQHKPDLTTSRRLTPTSRIQASTPDVVWVQCPAEAQALGATCGKLPVPFDRRHPERGKIRIYFEVYPHSAAGSAESAILVNFGGPGGGTTTSRDLALALLEANLDVHDLLLIDDRGRGYSDTVDCEELQHGTAPPFSHEVENCAAQLGEADSFYGTGDIAQDTEAVRAALGYDKVDYFGWSYGGDDVAAYATRFGQNLRSIVLDAPDGTPGRGAFASPQFETHAMPRLVRLDCRRSPTCSVDHSDPDVELDQLIRAVRSSPLKGEAFDANGNLVRVRIDEENLLNALLENPTGNFTNTGELLAAATALEKSDSLPMLRLGAESIIPLATTDYGAPTDFSIGGGAASACADFYQPWDWSASVSERLAQFRESVAALPENYFSPFSKAAATDLPFNLVGKGCLWWQKLNPSSPITPPNPVYPQVPTLILDGDMDPGVTLEEVRKVAPLFPGSIFLPVAEAGHGTFLWSQCAASLESQFIENLQTGDTSCTQTPETIWPALGR